MIETYATNNYLKTRLHEIEKHLGDDGEIPGDVIIDFVNELNVSTLMIPGIINGDDLDFEVLASEDDDMNVIALFTDSEEFQAYYPSGTEYGPVANDIGFYIDLVREYDLEGVILNPASSEFFLERDLLLELPLNTKIENMDDFKGYGGEELYEISKSINNDSLLEFMRSDNDSFEELMLELSKSTLLNLVVSNEDLTGYARGNVISRSDAGDFSICATGDEDNDFGVVFTGTDAIRQSLDDGDGMNHYYQVTLLDDLIEFILLSDMDGIIINPGLDDYLISREYLLQAYHGLTYDNPSFKNAADYAFIL